MNGLDHWRFILWDWILQALNKIGVLLIRKKEGTAVGPAIKKVCHTRENGHLEQEEKGRTQDSIDTWHSYREGGWGRNAKCQRNRRRREPEKSPRKSPGRFSRTTCGSCFTVVHVEEL